MEYFAQKFQGKYMIQFGIVKTILKYQLVIISILIYKKKYQL